MGYSLLGPTAAGLVAVQRFMAQCSGSVNVFLIRERKAMRRVMAWSVCLPWCLVTWAHGLVARKMMQVMDGGKESLSIGRAF